MTGENQKRVEEIETRWPHLMSTPIEHQRCFLDIHNLLSTVKSLGEELERVKTMLNTEYKKERILAGEELAQELADEVKALRRENLKLRALIRTQETEPPADVPDDQTTEMAVRIAALESDLAKEKEKNKRADAIILHYEQDLTKSETQLLAANERGEKMREAILAYQKANNHAWQSNPPTAKEAIKVSAEIEAAEKMMYNALAETQGKEER